MPYFLTSDTFDSDPVWTVLAEGRRALIDALQASHQRLMSRASHHTSNGYLDESTARSLVSSKRVLTLLTKPILGQPAKLHRRGDDCDCLGDEWIDGYTYRLHAFLRRNPSRKEYERNRAQTADLRDSRLKALVFERDGGCCRYCRSGKLSAKAGRARDRRKFLQYDHVDPDAPAGRDGENFVICCARCNEYKGHRTPDEAGMSLLPVPTDAERAEWAARDPALFDRDDWAHLVDQQPITDEPPTEHDHVDDSDVDRDPDHDHGQPPPGDQPTSGHARPDQDEQHHHHPTADAAKGPGWVGHALTHSPQAIPRETQPARDSSAPDIYHRRSRAAPPPNPQRSQPPGREFPP
ncbi:HNH endonuclease [Saccharothrix australiensis]|uniref:HNH endonuclease n=1 Tax=Saccharothrix australiensis TaxID=2072 RepID=A0A495VLU7_9PSEU|nr:hypothetical protein [Saccharothrix australiensis]RKT49295.1 HNH endonuclease [Saccharothrix australiensis]